MDAQERARRDLFPDELLGLVIDQVRPDKIAVQPNILLFNWETGRGTGEGHHGVASRWEPADKKRGSEVDRTCV